jgi:hypothetical protein
MCIPIHSSARFHLDRDAPLMLDRDAPADRPVTLIVPEPQPVSDAPVAEEVLCNG